MSILLASCSLPPPSKLIHKHPASRECGFTLIVSLGLLTSLLLVGISLSTMASIEVRKAEQRKALTQSKANARLAALQALDLLQHTTGPDQRVTAPSGIWEDGSTKGTDLDDSEQYWTGVYHSQKRNWDQEANEWVTEGRTQDARNGEYKASNTMPQGLTGQVWLVSGHDMKDQGGKYLDPKSVRNSNSKVTIHDGTKQDEADKGDVHVLAVELPKDNKQSKSSQSRYAYWVSDEGAKAKINLQDDPKRQYPTKNNGAAGMLRDKLNVMSPRFSPLTLEGAKNGDDRELLATKLVSPEGLKEGKDPSIPNAKEEPLSHHFTTDSKGVLADVSRGGLKKDLSRGLGDQFVEKLAGEVMWEAPLPERSADGSIVDLDTYASLRDKNVNYKNPTGHRSFLRGPIWDMAHSWYSLYLPKPPFIPAFYGGVQAEYHPTKTKNQSGDLVGNEQDPTIYKYSPNPDSRGPKSNLTHSTNPNIEPRSPAGAVQNNWVFRNNRNTTRYFTNKPVWQHSSKDTQNFKIDFTKNGYPPGTEFWRRENIRHTLAPVLIEYNLEVGFFPVDATILWDLSVDDSQWYYPYRCTRDGYDFYRDYFRDYMPNPGEAPPVEGEPVEPPNRNIMPRCDICGKNDLVDFTGGYRDTGQTDPEFGLPIFWPNTRKVDNMLHLDKTKYRMEIVMELLNRGLTVDGPGIDGLIAHRTPKFREWFTQTNKDLAQEHYGKQVHEWGLGNDKKSNDLRSQFNLNASTSKLTIQQIRKVFLAEYPFLDMEKTSYGLANGNITEREAIKMMEDMYKLVLMLRPTLVYWNPYNVQLNDVHPEVYAGIGNIHARWINANGDFYLPDASINTSQGPLKFQFWDGRGKNAGTTPKDNTTGINWMSLWRTPVVDRFTGQQGFRFDRWYGFNVPDSRGKPPFYRHDFRDPGIPNQAFSTGYWDYRYRFRYRADLDRFNKKPEYNFAPGEIKVFTPDLVRQSTWVNISPEQENGFVYSMPTSHTFLRGQDVINDIKVFTFPSGSYEYNPGDGAAGRSTWGWEIETLVQSNRDTFKTKHTNPEFMHVGRIDRLIPTSDNPEIDVTIGKSVGSLYPAMYPRWTKSGFWNGRGDPIYGGIRNSEPKIDNSRNVPDSYRGPNFDHNLPFLKNLTEMVSGRLDSHLMMGYNFRLKASESNPKESLSNWAHLNARSHDILRNGEKDGAPFGWECQILSREDILKSVPSISSGVARWGNSFTMKGKSRIAMVDIPRQPMHSIVELTNADLAKYNMAPTFAVGNSYASPFIPPNQAFTVKGKYNLIPADDAYFTQEANANSKYQFFNPFNHTLPDFSYQLNKALFDRYFFSTVPDYPYNATSSPYSNPQFVSRNYPPFEDVNQDFIEKYFDPKTKDPKAYLLPNPRMKYYSPDGTMPQLKDLHDFDSAAANLLVDGSFNVNSTSVQAWAALLRSLKQVDFKHTMGTYPSGNQKENTPFLRGINPYWGPNDIWQGFTEVTETQIQELAEALVSEIRKRGPFLSLAEFINRKLVNPVDVDQGTATDPNRPWRSGAVQAALDKTINRDKFMDDEYGVETAFEPKGTSHWIASSGKGTVSNNANYFKENTEGMMTGTGIPGWTLQSDVLRPLAPILNARSDTFTIRGYGDVKKNGSVRAKAMCELLVQRLPEYVNNDAHSLGSEFLVHSKEKETWYAPDPGFEQGNKDRNLLIRESKPELMENFRLGRRYKVLQFRWL